MNREILFRGKHRHILPGNDRLDGIWVYGYLSDENYINTLGEDEYGGKFTSEVLIDPETACQYTGLVDKNGRKIFEGDILEFTDCELGKENYTVFWNQVEWGIRSELGNIDDLRDWDSSNWEVIGNIFDNPELLN